MSVDTTNAAEAVVAVSGDVYVAPVGTPLPTLVRTPLADDFFKLGLISEDGVSLIWAPEIDEFHALQEELAIRRELRQQRIAVTFDMLQWDEVTVPLALGGGIVAEFGVGQFRYDLPGPDQPTVERSIVIDWDDGDRAFRLVFARGTVLGELSTSLRRSAMATLPLGFDCLAVSDGGTPGYLFLSADPNVEPPPTGTSPEFGEGTFGDGTFG